MNYIVKGIQKIIVKRFIPLTLAILTIISCCIPTFAATAATAANTDSINNIDLSLADDLLNNQQNENPVKSTYSNPNNLNDNAVSSNCFGSSCTYDSAGNMTCCSNTDSTECNTNTSNNKSECTNGCTHEGPCTYDDKGNMTCCSSKTDNSLQSVTSTYNLINRVQSSISLPKEYASTDRDCTPLDCNCHGHGIVWGYYNCISTPDEEGNYNTHCSCTVDHDAASHHKTIYKQVNNSYPRSKTEHIVYTGCDLIDSYVKQTNGNTHFSLGYLSGQLSHGGVYAFSDWQEHAYGEENGKHAQIIESTGNLGDYCIITEDYRQTESHNFDYTTGTCYQCNYYDPEQQIVKPPCTGCSCNGDKGDVCTNAADCSCSKPTTPPCSGDPCDCGGTKKPTCGDPCTCTTPSPSPTPSPTPCYSCSCNGYKGSGCTNSSHTSYCHCEPYSPPSGGGGGGGGEHGEGCDCPSESEIRQWILDFYNSHRSTHHTETEINNLIQNFYESHPETHFTKVEVMNWIESYITANVHTMMPDGQPQPSGASGHYQPYRCTICGKTVNSSATGHTLEYTSNGSDQHTYKCPTCTVLQGSHL